MGAEENKQQKKPYEKPTVTRLTGEQAKLKLMGYAMIGNENAKALLDILFQRENEQSQKQQYEKPTATKLTREQARMKLMGQVMMGNKEARELLDILFEEENQHEEDQENDDTGGKKSA